MKELLLHICCGPCSVHPATLLSQDYQVIGYFYNPNIWPYEEWLRRYGAFEKFCKESGAITDYFPKKPLTEEEFKREYQEFLNKVKGLEGEPEGGKRCSVCFKLRLKKAAQFARENKIIIFASTLTIGRNKRPEIINPIGVSSAMEYDIDFFEANWKKQDGARKGCEISKKHELYRQHYCGCEFSNTDKNRHR
ncbi:epoxyqueuosine reductase QueH [Patescibacteria group bacterium]|nr:epoxyqueuosine reductase QueH [Patescibacteria group bacterium]